MLVQALPRVCGGVLRLLARQHEAAPGERARQARLDPRDTAYPREGHRALWRGGLHSDAGRVRGPEQAEACGDEVGVRHAVLVWGLHRALLRLPVDGREHQRAAHREDHQEQTRGRCRRGEAGHHKHRQVYAGAFGPVDDDAAACLAPCIHVPFGPFDDDAAACLAPCIHVPFGLHVLREGRGVLRQGGDPGHLRQHILLRLHLPPQHQPLQH
mmetsp:Transcript_66491/g.163909  ORF Transcript_66491/g.163909 Transcript_66491/m.163909 type:complete len:213 (+) Transcript_66491:70-708(+)